MQKPADLATFTKLVKGMNHRERFVFNWKYTGYIEIYSTVLLETTNETNVKLSFIDYNGDTTHKNRLLKLCSSDYFSELFDIIK